MGLNMRTSIYKLFNFLDDVLELTLSGVWKNGKKWPFTSLALLLLACLSLIFLAGPCSTTGNLPVESSCSFEHKIPDQLYTLLKSDISGVSLDSVTENELSTIVNSETYNDSEHCSDSETCNGDNSAIAGLSQFFYQRPFLDKLPRDQHDKYNVFFFTDKSVGAYIEVEYMKQINEFFLFKKVLNRFAYVFPYSNLKGMTRYTLESCDGPGTFDLKLTIINDPKNNKQKRVFYSWKSFKPPASN